MRSLCMTHDACDQHEMGPGHPERPARRPTVMKALEEAGLLADVEVREAPRVTPEALERVHAASYVKHVYDSAPQAGLAALDPDTAMSPGTLEAAERAAGALELASRLVVQGEVERAFCAVRPPGHHAESDRAMGFCFFNHVAVGAAAALEMPGIERVAILDFDVHHGNGTVEIFQDRPEVLVCSSFQHPFYPNRYHDVQADHLVYTKLAAGTESGEFRQAIERDWLPALERHRPQIVFVSAGFDAHRQDPLGGLRLEHEDFAWITQLIVEAARDYAGGRIISTLEGGYDLDALGSSAAAHVRELLT